MIAADNQESHFRPKSLNLSSNLSKKNKNPIFWANSKLSNGCFAWSWEHCFSTRRWRTTVTLHRQPPSRWLDHRPSRHRSLLSTLAPNTHTQNLLVFNFPNMQKGWLVFCSMCFWADSRSRRPHQQLNSILDQRVQHKKRRCCSNQQRLQWLRQPLPSHRSRRCWFPPRLFLCHLDFLSHLLAGLHSSAPHCNSRWPKPSCLQSSLKSLHPTINNSICIAVFISGSGFDRRCRHCWKLIN